MVVLEGDRAAVVGPGVGFDHGSLGAPEEVDFEAAEPDVDLGVREAAVVDDREEERLEVRAGAVGGVSRS